jgi:inner membrane protein
MIQSLIDERTVRRDSAIEEVSSKWGGVQNLAGPILTIPYKKMVGAAVDKGEAPKQVEETFYAHFLPQTLSINGQLAPEMLQRGIYKVVAYNSQMQFTGEFPAPDFKNVDSDIKSIMWENAVLSVGIPDMQGIKDGIKIKFDGKEYDAQPGLGTTLGSGGMVIDDFGGIKEPTTVVKPLDSGVNVKLPLNATTTQKKLAFAFALNLNGSQQLNFIPLGSETNVEMTSSWANPSFDGAFVPDEREVNKDGFKAKWKILQLNRNFPQSWSGDYNGDLLSSAFGVNLLIPVDEYQKNTRSVKYAIMIIALTFLIFFFAEVKNGIRIHPIHYILVGLALVLFFSLLLSVSEHLNFNLAYLVASLSTLIMVTLYSRHIFKNNTLTLLQSGILVLIYAFIFTIIQLQDFALLVGNIGLFIILAIVMYISRKINWYETARKE